MKAVLKIELLILIAFLVTAPLRALVVQDRRSSPDEPRYDTNTVATFAGVVSALSSHTGRRGTPRTRATIKTNDGLTLLHIGPTSFLNEMKLRLAEGDSLTVIGSRVRDAENQELVIVRELTKGKQVLALRNTEGRPLWDERFK